MRSLLLIFFLCSVADAVAQNFDEYCKKNLKERISVKKRKNICLCVEENMHSQLAENDRDWLMRQVVNYKYRRQSASVEPNESGKKRIRAIEFEMFKNCSTNYKWKWNADDLGVPDDITTP